MVDLVAASNWSKGGEHMPASLLELIEAGPSAWDYARRVLAEVSRAGNPTLLRASSRRVVGFERKKVRFLAPIHPVSLRDAYAFEQHVKKASENRGRPVPEDWYRFPAFYYTNPNTVIGHDAPLPWPRYTKALDYELEIAAVIGRRGIDWGADNAANSIFGFTIFNDWSARDIQRAELKTGLGPAKSKDFGSSLGPCIITLDELADRATGRPGVFDLAMTARVNGEEKSRGNFKDIYWSFGEIIARISDETPLSPGEVIGSGTVGTGCLLELTKGEGPWLKPGDVVELEIERIGVLRNTVTDV
ncbi:MAG: fumarylacetoacetate hydrolase family protein [Chloroflexi bacterium]|nr:fumarylacetoacetate hydrolase family protein [Chloroflexota bacterium]